VARKKLRKVGDIMLDMEILLLELHEKRGHDMQHGEVLYLINAWQNIHVPEQREVYTSDGDSPILNPIYGPKEKRK
jgi:hypothetical protein